MGNGVLELSIQTVLLYGQKSRKASLNNDLGQKYPVSSKMSRYSIGWVRKGSCLIVPWKTGQAHISHYQQIFQTNSLFQFPLFKVEYLYFYLLRLLKVAQSTSPTQTTTLSAKHTQQSLLSDICVPCSSLPFHLPVLWLRTAVDSYFLQRCLFLNIVTLR